jgi:hypothetical protein
MACSRHSAGQGIVCIQAGCYDLFELFARDRTVCETVCMDAVSSAYVL